MSQPQQSIIHTAAPTEAIATTGFNLPWEACGNLIRDKLTAGGGGFLMAEVPVNLGNSCARAEFIVRACNAHEELQRMAELVVSAAKYRRDQEWKLMHLDLSEAAEIALRHTAGVQP